MSAIELPVATKRSARFKRFSWNRAGDGTFPPIASAPQRTLLLSNFSAKPAPAADAGSMAQKKAVRPPGKKRKSVYLGPSWDDQAGTLPTSSNAGDMDFDALLLQMVS
ncbi:hypothetical protein H4S01_003699 [Coemansia sp. RSA 2610]|nr:hypothetical protein H4S01_003699 [Coemansia sp. RSA 2610]